MITCPHDGKELVFMLTMDEGSGDTLHPFPSYHCPKCFFRVHDWEDEFEYPPNYDELETALLKEWSK